MSKEELENKVEELDKVVDGLMEICAKQTELITMLSARIENYKKITDLKISSLKDLLFLDN